MAGHGAPRAGPRRARRPLWLPRAFKPDASTYRLEPVTLELARRRGMIEPWSIPG